MKLEYITEDEFIEKGFSPKGILEFDSGYPSFNNFIWEDRKIWQEKLSGITYFLVDTDNKEDTIIYAYATLSITGLLVVTEKEENEYVSSLEIRLFATNKRVHGQTDSSGVKYSHIFFALLLQELWIAATTKLSFKTIFLQANTAGKNVYEEFGFTEIERYIVPTIDDKVEVNECIPMLCEISDEFMYKVFL